MEDPRDKVESLVSEIERYDFFISEEDIFAKNEAKKVRGHESRGYDILYNETKGLQQKIEEYVKSESAE